MGPKVQAVAKELERRGGEEWLWEQLSGLRALSDIAKDLGCTPRALYVWRDQADDRRAEWAASLRVSGDAYAEEGKGILDQLAKEDPGKHGLPSSKVALASERARSRMKIAAARHPEAWGERAPASVVQVNIGTLHLDALRAHGSMTLQGKPLALEAPARPALYVPPPLDAIVEPEPIPTTPPAGAYAFGPMPAPTRAIQTADVPEPTSTPHESAPEAKGPDPVSLPEPDPFQAPDRGPIWG